MTLADEVLVYIQENWSQHGAEVKSHGDTTVTLTLPPELVEISQLCLELDQRFGAAVDLKHPSAAEAASCLTIRLTRSNPPPPEFAAARFAVLAGVLCAAGLSIQHTGAHLAALNLTRVFLAAL
jgi:hypothetical protein